MLTHRKRAADSGFTLVELVIAVSVLGLVMSAVCAAMLTAISTNRQTGERLDKSNDVKFAATWFAEDVASGNSVTTNTAAVCGATATALLNVTSTDVDTSAGVPATPMPPAAPVTRRISYVLVDHGTYGVLERRACVASGPARVDRIAKRVSTSTPPVVSAVAGPTISITLTAADDGASFTFFGTRRPS